jgi:hypothetical protein
MTHGFLTTLSVECDAVKLGLGASVLKEEKYQALWHNITDHDA